MSLAVTVLQTALPVFGALLLGVLCRSRNILTRDGVDTLKKVVLDLALTVVTIGLFVLMSILAGLGNIW